MRRLAPDPDTAGLRPGPAAAPPSPPCQFPHGILPCLINLDVLALRQEPCPVCAPWLPVLLGSHGGPAARASVPPAANVKAPR